jgi:RNA polymerase sigma-70 factor (ECF subfamily)
MPALRILSGAIVCAKPVPGRKPVKGKKMPTILEAYLENELALKRFLRRFIKSREGADDLAQEAFLRAFAAEADHVIASPKAFLFKVAKNLALNQLARQATAATEPLGDFEDLAVLEDSSQAAVDDAVDGRERLRMLARAIAALPPQCAKVFILRKMQGLSQKEIAARLNISVRTVENHVALGLVRCKAYMRAHGGAPEQGSAIARIAEPAAEAFVKAKVAE